MSRKEFKRELKKLQRYIKRSHVKGFIDSFGLIPIGCKSAKWTEKLAKQIQICRQHDPFDIALRKKLWEGGVRGHD